MLTLLKTNKLDITSSELTLVRIVEEDMIFNIPIYQRLYVWEEEQVRTLMADLYRAFTYNNNENYYLGGIMLSKNNNKLDLIDGQQRFTTLWLVSKALKGELSKFTFTQIDKNPISRISFSVRDFANNYFNSSDELRSITDAESKELDPINNALDTIKNYIKDEVEEVAEFSKFIYNHVLFIATKMPETTDENKVFEAMNNRGVQLQQHEILKSKLLSKLGDDRMLMHRYGLMWDACSIMDDYLEMNIKLVANLEWKDLFPETKEEDEIIELTENILDRLSSIIRDNEDNSLMSILEDKNLRIEEEEAVKENLKSSEDEKYDSGKVRSIIDFPMLLLHTLRIYQFKIKDCRNAEDSVEVKGKSLVHIFDKNDSYFQTSQDVQKFIVLLWNVRKQFDKYVIKWVSNVEENNEVHLIKRLYKSDTSFQRRALVTNEGFALLQSMLYHSQQLVTHYWLTPFLNKMLDIDDFEQLEIYLQRLDNEMFCNKRRDLRTMSFELLSKETEELKGSAEFVADILKSNLGTSFPSYWFYKLEYVLWLNRGENNHWQNYKMTAKNSVEHISPQNPKPEDSNIVYDVTDTQEEQNRKNNDFGNLVLLSPGMNSEYSNKTFKVKKAEFEEKKRLDSLKSDLIFRNEIWNWDKCKTHRDEMIDLIESHINSNKETL